MQKYVEQRSPKTKSEYKKIISNFSEFFDEFPQFEDTLLCDLIKNCMNRMKGKFNAHLPEAIRNLLQHYTP